MHEEENLHDDELLEGGALDLDDAFDDADLNDEGMESLEENFDEYENDEEDSGFESHDEEY